MKLKLAGAVLAAALVPAGALAHHGGTQPNPAHTCKALTPQALAALYGTGSNAFGKCVSTMAKEQQEARSSAAATCRAERADQNFAATHAGKTFAQFYGTGNLKNAFGKCVSAKAKAADQQTVRNTNRAAKQCKAMTAAQLQAAGYGTGRNAYGKCVSARSQAQND